MKYIFLILSIYRQAYVTYVMIRKMFNVFKLTQQCGCG